MGITAAITAMALGSAYSAYQQGEAQDDAAKAQRDAEMRARKLEAERKPLEEKATMSTGGATPNANALNQLNLLVDPNKRVTKTTGLGSVTNTTGLGFGG